MIGSSFDRKSAIIFNLLISGLAIIVIASVLLLSADHKTNQTLKKLIREQKTKLILQTERKHEQLNVWFEELTFQGKLFVNDSLIREYTTRIDNAGNLSELLKPLNLQDSVIMNQQTTELATQLALMQNTLKEFARFGGFSNGRIINSAGLPFIATSMILPPLNFEQKDLIEQVGRTGDIHFSLFRKTENRLLIDICLPILPVDIENSSQPVGFLLLTKDATSSIKKLLEPFHLSKPDGNTLLLQKKEDKYFFIETSPEVNIQKVPIDSLPAEPDLLPFANRTSYSDQLTEVYSFGLKDSHNDLWIIQEVKISGVKEQIKQPVQAIYAIAWLGIAAIMLVTILIWWILLGVQRKKIANNFKKLAHQIDGQQQFIHSINTSINDFITLKDLNGKFIYTNKSFNVAIGKTPEEIVGLSSADLFDPETTAKLVAKDHRVMDGKQKVTITESIIFNNEAFHFQISKAPYLDKERNVIGVVEVYRDITDFLEIQKKNELHNLKTIEALNSAIAAVDPYLSGHTRLLSYLSENIADILDLDEKEKTHLIMAANLSQIGKAFIPREILTKPEQLSADEIVIVQKHVNYGLQILRETEVHEDVLTTIHQMHERLDGSGYPQKLEGDKIIYIARILGLLNVFSAIIQPRAYRKSDSIENAITLLFSQANCFDMTVTKALNKLINRDDVKKTLTEEFLIQKNS